jgi:ketosteroid isomerase-like protein
MSSYWKSDSLMFIGSKGISYGWQKVYDNYVKGYPDRSAMGTLHFTIIEIIQLSPTVIYVVGKWQLEKEKPAGGHFTLMWRKIGGQWLIVSDHTS